MGATASIGFQDDEIISRERAIEISGEYWNEEEWKSIAKDGNVCGEVWNSKVSEFISQLNRTSDCPTQRSRRPGLDEREFENEEWCFLVGCLVNPICLLSHGLEPLSSLGAVLHGYQIVFVPSNALLLPCQGSSCHGVLYKIHAHELSIFDKAMSSVNYGEILTKKKKAKVYQYNGIEVECWVYVMDRTKNSILEGASSPPSSPLSSSVSSSLSPFSSSSFYEITTNNEIECAEPKICIEEENINMQEIMNKEDKDSDDEEDEDDFVLYSEITEIITDDAIADLVGPNFKAICYHQEFPEQRLMETLIQGYIRNGVKLVYLDWLRKIKSIPRIKISQLDEFPIGNKLIKNQNEEFKNDVNNNINDNNNSSKLPIWNKNEFIEQNRRLQEDERQRSSFLTCCNGKVLLFDPSLMNNNPSSLSSSSSSLSENVILQIRNIFSGQDSELFLCFEQYDPLYGIEDDIDHMSSEHRKVLEHSLKNSPIGHLFVVIAWRVDIPAID